VTDPAAPLLGFTLTPEQSRFSAQHVRLAYREAHKMSERTGIPYDELQGPALIGLCKGASTFDASRGWQPSSYLCPKIRGELLHFIRDKTYLLRIPHKVRELWMTGRRHLPYGRSDAWIARECGVELEVWLDCRAICSGPPVELNEAVQGQPAAVEQVDQLAREDDRTGALEAAVAAAWDSSPTAANSVFWGINMIRHPSRRLAAVEVIIDAALNVLESGKLPAPAQEDSSCAPATAPGPTRPLAVISLPLLSVACDIEELEQMRSLKKANWHKKAKTIDNNMEQLILSL